MTLQKFHSLVLSKETVKHSKPLPLFPGGNYNKLYGSTVNDLCYDLLPVQYTHQLCKSVVLTGPCSRMMVYERMGARNYPWCSALLPVVLRPTQPRPNRLHPNRAPGPLQFKVNPKPFSNLCISIIHNYITDMIYSILHVIYYLVKSVYKVCP